MDFKTYIQSVVSSYLEKENSNAIFIKHYNTLDISKNEILANVENADDNIIFYHEYKMHEMHSCYEPFLQWIGQCYKTYYEDDMSVETFLKKCKVYPMHVEPLACFIRGEACTRREDPLFFELGYEKERMVKNILSILDHIAKEHHLILILSKLHLAPYSTLDFLHTMVKSPIKIHTVLMYNDEFIINDYKKSAWNRLMQEADSQNLQLEWGSLDSQNTMDIQDEFWFDKKYVQEYYSKMNDMFYILDFEDAYYYMTNIMNRLDEKTVRFARNDHIKYLLLAAMIYMNFDQIDMSLVMCDKLADMQVHRSDDLQLRYDYYYTCAKARMFDDQIEPVKKCCEQCVEIAWKMGSGLLEFRAMVLMYIMYSSMGRNLFAYEFKFRCDPEILELSERYEYWNFLAYIYIFGFDNDPEDLRDIATGVKERHYFDLAIKIGKRLDNKSCILNAYMKNIVQYSEAGYHSYVRQLYKERIQVLGDEGPIREAHMFAGLGYNSLILEDYEGAHDYLKRSITNLTRIEQPMDAQPLDIMNSMYNLALIHFVAENYRASAAVVEMILKMLKEMRYNAIYACSNTKLYTFIAISSFYLGEYYNSYFYLSKMDILIEHMIKVLAEQNDGNWGEDLMLYHLVKGTMYSYENDFELSLSEFKKLKEVATNLHGSLFFVMPIYSVELSSLYRKQGMIKEAEAAIDEGIKFCEDENMPRKKERLLYFKEHHVRLNEPISVMEDDLPIEQMMQATRRAGNEVRLAKREKDIQFLTALQEAISRENMSVDDLYFNTSAVIKNSYNLDEIIILRRRNGRREYVLGDSDHSLSDEGFDGIFDFFLTYKQAFLSNRTDKNFNQFLPLMDYFYNKPVTMTLVGVPIMEDSGIETILIGYMKVKRKMIGSNELLNGDDLMILKFAFSQFCEMMRRIDSRNVIERMNHKLEQSAITDHLTGITNRTGFSKQAEIICAQSNRTNNILIYLDLDNFKYYNDTFGHEVGDLVLVTFAEIFKRMTQNKGLAVRYGGDEFIILLYDQSELEGVQFAEQIYDEIKDGFVDRIKKKLNMEITIPDDRKISCSIGIASFKGGSKEELETALNRADQMLYYVKRHGKSHYKLYDGKEETA